MSVSTTTGQPPVGYGTLIRKNHNFRNMWFGQIISLLGDWFNLIASASLIAQLTQSGTAIGGLFVVRMLAPFLISPIAGVVADRYNRKYVLIVTDLSRALTVFCFLFIRQAEHIWLLYALTAIQLGISGFFFPTRNAILPDIVSPQELGAANALSSATWSVMLALGAAIGGLVSGIWGIYPAFTIDALSFLVSAFFILQIRYQPTTDLPNSDKTINAALHQYVEGLRYLQNHRDILFISLHKAAVSVFVSGGFQVVQVALAQEIFPIGEGGGISLGLMFGMAGIGTGLGPIIARRFTGDRDQPMRRAIIAGYLLSSVGLIIVAPLLDFYSVLLGTIVRGIGGGVVWVFSTQLLLQLVPNEIRGRIFATEFAIFTLMGAASAAVVGTGLDHGGIGPLIWLMSVFILLPGILWGLWVFKGKQQRIAEEADVPVSSNG